MPKLGWRYLYYALISKQHFVGIFCAGSWQTVSEDVVISLGALITG